MNKASRGSFKAFSAGSLPSGRVNPMAIETLVKKGISAQNAESKSWNVFSLSSAPRMDFVITLCDQAAGEVCPVWPGQPSMMHWSLPDPSAVKGMRIEQCEAFENVFSMIERKIDHFLLQTPAPSLLAERCAQGEVLLYD